MKLRIKLAACALLPALSMIAASPASASLFHFEGGTPGILPTDWNPTPSPDDLAIGNSITTFKKAGEGVKLSGPADLLYTYVGKEAGSANAFVSSNKFFLTDNPYFPGTTPGSSFEIASASPGFLDFSFIGLGTCCVAPGVYTNGQGSMFNTSLSLAAAMVSPTRLYLMFGDGFGDSDFDDMVVRVDATAIASTPVPATVWLFITGMIGLFGINRRHHSKVV